MKKMHKLLALVLALTMMLAMATSVSADPTATGNIEINNPSADLIQELYKIADYVDDGSGNSWYKVDLTGPWASFAQEYFELDDRGFILSYTEGSDFSAAMKSWLEQTDENGVTNYAKVKDTAIALTEGKAEDQGLGYYILVTLQDETDANGVATRKILSNIGAAGLTEAGETLKIRQKNTPDGLPQVDKTVTGLNTGYRVGDVHEYKIEILCDEGSKEYTITDTMTHLKLVGTVDDIKVEVFSDPAVTEDKITREATENGFKIVVKFDEGSAAYDKIVLTYTAEVTADGVDNVKNFVQVDTEHETVTDEVTQKNAGFDLVKSDGTTNADGTPKVLEGAQFELYLKDAVTNASTLVKVVKDAAGYYRPATAEEITAGTGVLDQIPAGQATVKCLKADAYEAGLYYLVEKTAPAGYVGVDGEIATQGQTTIQVNNTKADELPETGGMGTTLFYTFGTIMALGAAVLLITKKRMAA